MLGKGVSTPHVQRSAEETARSVPVIQMNFCFLKSDGSMTEDSSQPWATTLVVMDVASQNLVSISIPTKSDELAYTVASTVAFVKRMSYVRARLRTDGEPAIIALAEKVKMKLLAEGMKVDVETSPRYSSKSMGAVGRAQRTLEGQVRSMKADVELSTSLKVDPDWPIWPWLVRHAGWLLERFHVRANNRTAFEDCFDVKYKGEVLKFGERALFWVTSSPSGRVRAGVRLGKADAKFEKGILDRQADRQ